MKTKIIFNALGRPLWLPVPDTGKFIHRLDDYRQAREVTFTDADREWFRKPLSHEA